MGNMRLLGLASCCVASVGCSEVGMSSSQEVDGASSAEAATLYRNSTMARELRIHFSTFDADDEVAGYNLNNCQMVARALNANYREMAGLDNSATTGFWCEPGEYQPDGKVPKEFDSEFPTGVRANAAP